MKKMTQAQGWKRMNELHRDLAKARNEGDAVKVDELEKAIEKLAD